jgi:hypothetical protein
MSAPLAHCSVLLATALTLGCTANANIETTTKTIRSSAGTTTITVVQSRLPERHPSAVSETETQ